MSQRAIFVLQIQWFQCISGLQSNIHVIFMFFKCFKNGQRDFEIYFNHPHIFILFCPLHNYDDKLSLYICPKLKIYTFIYLVVIVMSFKWNRGSYSCANSFISFYWLPISVYNIEGSRPEWCISSMIYSRDTPFWSGTLDMLLLKYSTRLTMSKFYTVSLMYLLQKVYCLLNL